MAKAEKDTRKFTDRRDADVILSAERILGAQVVTFASQFDNPKTWLQAGGMCSCCGAGPRIDGIADWWLVFKAGLADGDGVYYSMLCDNPTRDGCLTEIRRENERRKKTARDEAAEIVTELMDGDLDGAEAMMEDLEALDL